MRVLHIGWGYRPWWSGGGLILYTEALVAGQAARGHEVSYLLGGRELPVLRQPRLHRWRRDGVQMLEVLGSRSPASVERGARRPELELDEPATERVLAAAMARARPELIHIHTVEGLPSSTIELALRQGVPTAMTLADYHTICPTVKLWDHTGAVCERLMPGATCVACCADGLHGTEQQRYMTRQLAVRSATARAGQRAGAVVDAVWRRLPAPEVVEVPVAPPDAYDRRREVNVGRLSRVDALVAMSPQLAATFADRGVAADRLRTVRLTLPHIERLVPRHRDPRPGPVRFTTLNGAASTAKGADVLVGAVERLDAAGLGGGYELHVHGRVASHARAALERSPSVRLRGAYDPGDLDAVLADAHVGLVPSVWEEAYGFVGPELIAAGIPVISNERGGLPFHTLPGRTGWLNPSADGAGLADLAARLVRHPDEVAAMSAATIAHRGEVVRPFADHLDELEALYGELLERRAAATG